MLILSLFSISSFGCTLGGGGGYGGGGYGGGSHGGEYDPDVKPTRGSKPYTIRGKTYYPLASGVGFSEEGIASWYGKDFHGKLTANGERYDMHGMTAAHKLLPFNTQVRVTNLKNGRSIIVRINDRGPFIDKRVIDLTKTGAAKIDMIGSGTARVRVESIGAVPSISRGNQEGSFEMKGNFYVQIGAFGQKANANRLVSRIKASGKDSRLYHSNMLWLVQAGPYDTLNKAENARSSLLGQFPHCFVVAE